MIIQSLAERYAVAFINVHKEPAELRTNLKKLIEFTRELINSNQLLEALQYPILPFDGKVRILNDLPDFAAMPDYVKNFIFSLLKRDRLEYLEAIIAELKKRVLKLDGKLAVTVTVAKEISDTEKKELQDELAQSFSKKILMTTKVDPTVLGGVIVTVGNTVYDGSLKNSLDKFVKKLQ